LLVCHVSRACAPKVRYGGIYRVELERSHAQPPDGTRRHTCMVYACTARVARACTQRTGEARGGPVAHVQLQAKEISAWQIKAVHAKSQTCRLQITAPRGHPVGSAAYARPVPVRLFSQSSYTQHSVYPPVHRSMCKLLLLLASLHLAFTEFFLAYFDPFSCSHFSVLYFFSFHSLASTSRRQQIVALSYYRLLEARML